MSTLQSWKLHQNEMAKAQSAFAILWRYTLPRVFCQTNLLQRWRRWSCRTRSVEANDAGVISVIVHITGLTRLRWCCQHGKVDVAGSSNISEEISALRSSSYSRCGQCRIDQASSERRRRARQCSAELGQSSRIRAVAGLIADFRSHDGAQRTDSRSLVSSD